MFKTREYLQVRNPTFDYKQRLYYYDFNREATCHFEKTDKLNTDTE